MTPREAIIVLDKLNTDGRIEVDRDELRAAIYTVKTALGYQAELAPWSHDFEINERRFTSYICRGCVNPIEPSMNYCSNCGQKIFWDR